MTEVTIKEQITRITSSAIAIPFQFLCGGLLPTSSWKQWKKETRWVKLETSQIHTFYFSQEPRYDKVNKAYSHPGGYGSRFPLPCCPPGVMANLILRKNLIFYIDIFCVNLLFLHPINQDVQHSVATESSLRGSQPMNNHTIKPK